MIYGKEKLKGLHPDLLRVLEKLQETVDMDIRFLEGMRTLERQKKLVASGASKTMKSRHLTGHAVDIAPAPGGEASWAWPLYYKLAPQVKAAAKAVGVPIEWGGDWKSFKDGPHWQLPWDYTRSKRPLKAPAEPAGKPFVLLRRGSTGEDVRALQRLLKGIWSTLEVDGDYGPTTEARVKDFQRSHNLIVDGIVGEDTLKALKDSV